ncbi:MAG: UDP-N-acetylmuramoyl-L-alanyl-D-glutamate--2,6-diaminopimelate ligase [Clostridia bacterium]|nr:UDP-N-acetylmuramoyl-L-alanyl-D-glutamate--2,6-diaminopimelate ligase [Clostridia bacterium]
MKLNELIKNIPHNEVSDVEIMGITYNSRAALAGDLFVCLPGANRDGHDFARSAYDNGTRAFLCERKVDLPEDAVQVITPNTREALAVISADFYGRPADKLKIIGITGTKGKTTTSLLVAAILNASQKSCAYIGSNGVIINGRHIETANTTPESLQLHHYFSIMVEEGIQYVVIEVSSQALMHHRVEGLSFEVTAFTNFSPDHIGTGEHADLDEYMNAKKRLFDLYPSKAVIYNADDPVFAYMIKDNSAKKLSFSIEKEADLTASSPERYRNATSLGISFDCTADNVTIPVQLMTPGAFSVYNGLCAMAICSALGVSLERSAEVLSRTPVQGRFEIVEGKAGTTFVIDYSHNGISLTKALQTLREYEPRRLICVFGSVGGRTECRRQELGEAAAKFADYSIITSDNPDFEDPDKIIADIASFMKGAEYECIADRKSAIVKAIDMAKDGDIVLFAGKGHETYQLICGKKVPFSEREIIEETCASLALN